MSAEERSYRIVVEKRSAGAFAGAVEFLLMTRWGWYVWRGEKLVAEGQAATEHQARQRAEQASQNHELRYSYDYDPKRRRTRVRAATIRPRGQRWDEPDL